MQRFNFVLIISVVTVIGGVWGQPSSDICANSIDVDGTGYKNHDECDKYIQCIRDSQGNLFGQVRSCPFGTYWNMDILTCDSVEKTSCLLDKCGGLPDGNLYPSTTNCRGYWECSSDKSSPRCCPLGQKFNASSLSCVDVGENETACSDNCITHIFNVPTTCDKFPVPGKPGVYKQEVAGWGWMELYCAPGTQFHPDSCHCLNLVDIKPVQRACRPELHLPFTVDHKDESGVRHHVTNENVVVKNGVANFNGVNSRLIVPRFTNLEHSTTIVIKIKYSSNHTTFPGISKALVVNNGCGNVPSLMLAEDYENVYFGVGTDNVTFAFTSVSQVNNDPKEATYRFDNGTLTGSNGINTATTEAPGYFKNVKCALQIGRADDLMPFEGSIDELTVYLCDPDK